MLKYLLTYIPAKLLPAFINFLSIIIYARIFSQEEYGSFAYLLAVSTLIQGLIFPWIRMSLSRFIHQYEDEVKDEFIKKIYSIQSILSLFLLLIFTIIYFLSSDQQFLFILFIILSNSYVELIFANQRAEFQVKTFAKMNIYRAIVRLGLSTFLSVLLISGTQSLIWGFVIANILILVWNHEKVFNLRAINIKNDLVLIKDMLKYGLPLTISFLMVNILSSSDRIMINYFLGPTEVSKYSLSYDLAWFIVVNLITIINLAYFPLIMRRFSKNLKIFSRLNELYVLINVISIYIIVIIIMNSTYISSLVFGERYNGLEMSVILTLTTIGAYISSMKSYYYDIVFHLSKNTKIQVIPIAAAAIFNIICNIIVIPIHGINGAITVTILSYILALLLSIFLGRKLIKIPLFNKSVLLLYFLGLILVSSFHFIVFSNPLEQLIYSVIITTIVFFLYVFLCERKLVLNIIKGGLHDD